MTDKPDWNDVAKGPLTTDHYVKLIARMALLENLVMRLATPSSLLEILDGLDASQRRFLQDAKSPDEREGHQAGLEAIARLRTTVEILRSLE